LAILAFHLKLTCSIGSTSTHAGIVNAMNSCTLYGFFGDGINDLSSGCSLSIALKAGKYGYE
jgi:hypothetical protein